MQYICIDRYENNINLLKEYYSMSTLEKLDKVDLQILRTLQENARLTTKELAARVSLSSTPGVRTPQTIGKWRIYKKIYRCIGRRETKPRLRGILQCQAKKTEPGHCCGIYTDNSGYP